MSTARRTAERLADEVNARNYFGMFERTVVSMFLIIHTAMSAAFVADMLPAEDMAEINNVFGHGIGAFDVLLWMLLLFWTWPILRAAIVVGVNALWDRYAGGEPA